MSTWVEGSVETGSSIERDSALELLVLRLLILSSIVQRSSACYKSFSEGQVRGWEKAKAPASSSGSPLAT